MSRDHKNRALCSVLTLFFCFPLQLLATRTLAEEKSTAETTQTIHVSNSTWHDFSRLVDVQKGSHVSGVSQLKTYLNRFGYVQDHDHDAFSDVFDARLETAIALYQKNLGLPITGRLDTSTVALMSTPRCGVSDTHMINNNNNGLHTTMHYTYFGGKPKWNRDKLTYAFSKQHKLDYLTSDEVKTVFRRAFDQWANVIPVSFEEVDDYSKADLKIGFFQGDHGDGLPFDGVLGTLAHAFAPMNGRLHFDAGETWAVDDDYRSTAAVDLESVATHEIGHLLGLGHSSEESAVMYPSLRPRTKKVDLTVDDVAGVLKLYGPNPKLTLTSLTGLEDSLKNGGRFLSGNLTGYVLLVVLILFI